MANQQENVGESRTDHFADAISRSVVPAREYDLDYDPGAEEQDWMNEIRSSRTSGNNPWKSSRNDDEHDYR
jgi:hypothetical protein